MTYSLMKVAFQMGGLLEAFQKLEDSLKGKKTAELLSFQISFWCLGVHYCFFSCEKNVLYTKLRIKG